MDFRQVARLIAWSGLFVALVLRLTGVLQYNSPTSNLWGSMIALAMMCSLRGGGGGGHRRPVTFDVYA